MAKLKKRKQKPTKFKVGDVLEFHDEEDHVIFIITSIPKQIERYRTYYIKVLKRFEGDIFEDEFESEVSCTFDEGTDVEEYSEKLKGKFKLAKHLYGE